MSVTRRGKGLLKTIPAEVRGALRIGVAQAASAVVAVQKELAPVKSGKLRDSITFHMGDQADVPYAVFKAGGGGDKDLTAVITAGNTKVRYADLVEFGTAPHPQGGLFKNANPPVMHPGTPPRGFFFPGYRLARNGAKKILRKALTAGVDSVVKKA